MYMYIYIYVHMHTHTNIPRSTAQRALRSSRNRCTAREYPQSYMCVSTHLSVICVVSIECAFQPTCLCHALCQ